MSEADSKTTRGYIGDAEARTNAGWGAFPIIVLKKKFYDNDINLFFDDDFAEDVIYAAQPALPQNGITIRAIFDNAGQDINLFNGEIETGGPKATLKSSDVSGVMHGDTLTVQDGKNYYVRAVHDDGTGVTILTLSED